MKKIVKSFSAVAIAAMMLGTASASTARSETYTKYIGLNYIQYYGQCELNGTTYAGKGKMVKVGGSASLDSDGSATDFSGHVLISSTASAPNNYYVPITAYIYK